MGVLRVGPRLSACIFASLVGSTAGCAQKCGDFTFRLPATKAFYEAAGSPELAPPEAAYEECGSDFGTQGYWDVLPGESQIMFEPSGGRSAATFGDMVLTVSFASAAAKDGVTLTGKQIAGGAFTGLGTTRRDVATLTPSSTITLHSVGPATSGAVFDRRLLDVSWDLVWENAQGARYAAKGRDLLDMAVTKPR
jgi:hypothetical protein